MSLTLQQIRQINRDLAYEFINERLTVEPSKRNVAFLAHCIEQIEALPLPTFDTQFINRPKGESHGKR